MKKFYFRIIALVVVAVLCNALIIVFPDRDIFDAEDLPSTYTQLTGKKVADETMGSGILTYGPYVDIPSGESQIKVRYTADSEGNIARVYSQHNESITADYKLDQTKGELVVDLKLEKDIKDFEVQIIYSGVGTLEITEISILSRRMDLLFVLIVYDVAFAALIALFIVKAVREKRRLGH